MSDLRIQAGEFTFGASFVAAAPRTVAKIRGLLPYRERIIHVRWSGEACWIPLGSLDLGSATRTPPAIRRPARSCCTPRRQRDGDPARLRQRAIRQQGGRARRQPLPDHRRRHGAACRAGQPRAVARRPRTSCSRRSPDPPRASPPRARRVNAVDLTVLVVVAFSGVLGFLRGMVREIFGLAAWIGAALIAVACSSTTPRRTESPTAGDSPTPTSPTRSPSVAVFLLVLIVLTLVARMAGRGGPQARRWAAWTVRWAWCSGLLRRGVQRWSSPPMCIAAAVDQPPEQWPDAVLEARTLPTIYVGRERGPRSACRMAYRPTVPVPPAQAGRPNRRHLLQANPVGRAGSAPPARP